MPYSLRQLDLNSRLNALPEPIYPAREVAAWEQRWFRMGNSSFGLMQQAALTMANQLMPTLSDYIQANKTLSHPTAHLPKIVVWCGAGNNGGDGYLLAVYLAERLAGMGSVSIYKVLPPLSADAKKAYDIAADNSLMMTESLNEALGGACVHIDALFGNGLDRDLGAKMLSVVSAFNTAHGLKIAIDLPSGLHPDTGMPLPLATQCDITLCLMGYKAGVLMGHAKSYVGKLICLPLIPADDELPTLAFIDNRLPLLAARHGKHSHQHKGNYGSLMVIGGSEGMGGAVMMAAESALKLGAGRVTVLTHKLHHPAILARTPALMVADMHDAKWLNQLISMDTLCIGMGMGRDTAAASLTYDVLNLAKTQGQTVVLDADALWHLATDDFSSLYEASPLPAHWIATPHHAEAARLLGTTADLVEADRIGAIIALQEKYGGQWLLKGANSLTIDAAGMVRICTLGNAKMATAGMGDTLAGMMAGILAQKPAAPIHGSVIHSICALHAHCGDLLQADTIAIDVSHMAGMAAQVLAHQDEAP